MSTDKTEDTWATLSTQEQSGYYQIAQEMLDRGYIHTHDGDVNLDDLAEHIWKRGKKGTCASTMEKP